MRYNDIYITRDRCSWLMRSEKREADLLGKETIRANLLISLLLWKRVERKEGRRGLFQFLQFSMWDETKRHCVLIEVPNQNKTCHFRMPSRPFFLSQLRYYHLSKCYIHNLTIPVFNGFTLLKCKIKYMYISFWVSFPYKSVVKSEICP